MKGAKEILAFMRFTFDEFLLNFLLYMFVPWFNLFNLQTLKIPHFLLFSWILLSSHFFAFLISDKKRSRKTKSCNWALWQKIYRGAYFGRVLYENGIDNDNMDASDNSMNIDQTQTVERFSIKIFHHLTSGHKTWLMDENFIMFGIKLGSRWLEQLLQSLRHPLKLLWLQPPWYACSMIRGLHS